MKIPALYINLDRAPERRAYMDAQFARLGLTVTRLAAVDGRQMDPAERDRWQTRNAVVAKLTPGEVATFLSHRAAWERIATGDTAYGAIFEDDIILSPDTRWFLHDTGWIDPLYGIVKLDTYFMRSAFREPFEACGRGRTIARLRSLHYGGAAYVLRRDHARALLAASKTFVVPIDHAMFKPESLIVPKLVVGMMDPALAMQQVHSLAQVLPQGAAASDVEAERTAARKLAKPPPVKESRLRRKILRPFRKLARWRRDLRARPKPGEVWKVVEYRE